MIRILTAAAALLLPGAAMAHHGELPTQAGALRAAEQQRAATLRDDPAAQLRAAEAAIASGRDAVAQELIERAEARLLTGGALAIQDGRAVLTGPAAHVSAARQALRGHDNARAVREIAAAGALLGQTAAR